MIPVHGSLVSCNQGGWMHLRLGWHASCTEVHTVFQVRFRLIKLPVVRNPFSPMAPRHSIDNWPRVARPSRFRSFCRPSRPSGRPPSSSCSTKNATCNTSRGFRVGGADSFSLVSQLSDRDLKGALGFNLVCY